MSWKLSFFSTECICTLDILQNLSLIQTGPGVFSKVTLKISTVQIILFLFLSLLISIFPNLYLKKNHLGFHIYFCRTEQGNHLLFHKFSLEWRGFSFPYYSFLFWFFIDLVNCLFYWGRGGTSSWTCLEVLLCFTLFFFYF